jgi:hypothetical protein
LSRAVNHLLRGVLRLYFLAVKVDALQVPARPVAHCAVDPCQLAVQRVDSFF